MKTTVQKKPFSKFAIFLFTLFLLGLLAVFFNIGGDAIFLIPPACFFGVVALIEILRGKSRGLVLIILPITVGLCAALLMYGLSQITF